jgi:CRISPR-associated protein Cas1
VSPFLIQRCAENGITLTLLDRNGKFMARVEGAVSGNVLLRKSQYSLTKEHALELAKPIVAAKIRNSRQILLRGARETSAEDAENLSKMADRLLALLRGIPAASDMDILRGIEGESARSYFSVFSELVKPQYREYFFLNGRNRRPPLDRMNAMLSFLYTLLTHDCRSALESVGLDPQCGFLHVLRPGRPSLALDLLEEFRAYLADRLALTLINRGQIKEKDFDMRPGGAVQMSDDARKTLLVAYQERKQEEIIHPLSEQTIPLGLLPHMQAALLARTLRGDMPEYVPFLAR